MKKIIACILLLCIIVSLVGCGSRSSGNVVQNAYSGELVDIFEKDGKTMLRIKTADGDEIDFTYADGTTDEEESRNLIYGQQVEVRCEEYYPDNGYRPLVSIKILE